MMKFRMMAVAATLFLAGAATGLAQVQSKEDSTPDTVVEARQSLMKKISQNQKAIGAYIAGNNPETTESLAGHAAAVKAMAGRIPAAFAAEPGRAGVDVDAKTRAMPVIWSQWPTFVSNANALERRAAVVQAAVEAGDQDTMQAAYANMTKSCVSCHEQFRAKKP